MSRIVISIVTSNSMRHLPEALAAIGAQTRKDCALLIVDNASIDGAESFVRSDYPRAIFLRNSKDLGGARARNQAIAYARAHLRRDGDDLFILTVNPDVVLAPDCVERLVEAVERRPDVGSACGKLLRVVSRGDGEMREGERTNVIDGAGLAIRKSRRVVARGAGETDGERYERTEEVFGVSGALALYRLAALDDVAYGHEVFDEDFFSYNDDVDLAWRLRLRGWASLYVPRGRAYRYRAAGAPAKSRAVNFYRSRNRLLVLAKNEQWTNALLHFPRILWREAWRPATFAAIPSFLRLLPRALAKRRLTMRRARTTPKQMRSWYT